jgi:hypothetical protein
MRLAVVVGLSAVCCCAASHPSPKVGSGQAANASVSLDATVYADPDSVRQAVTDDLGNHYIVVRLKLVPKGAPVPVQLEDFILRTDKDGEKSHPYVATQIAGQGVLVVSETASGGGGGHAQQREPSYGGMPPSGGGFGNAATLKGAEGKMHQDEKENPLVKTLAGRMLVEKETTEPVSGLLYFPMEKQKLKDLELIYLTPAGKLSIRFRP